MTAFPPMQESMVRNFMILESNFIFSIHLLIIPSLLTVFHFSVGKIWNCIQLLILWILSFILFFYLKNNVSEGLKFCVHGHIVTYIIDILSYVRNLLDTPRLCCPLCEMYLMYLSIYFGNCVLLTLIFICCQFFLIRIETEAGHIFHD
jgi:hypothetical protein